MKYFNMKIFCFILIRNQHPAGNNGLRSMIFIYWHLRFSFVWVRVSSKYKYKMSWWATSQNKTSWSKGQREMPEIIMILLIQSKHVFFLFFLCMTPLGSYCTIWHGAVYHCKPGKSCNYTITAFFPLSGSNSKVAVNSVEMQKKYIYIIIEHILSKLLLEIFQQ